MHTESKNPYNTRRKSIYFSPTTHSASVIEPPTAVATLSTARKHPAQHPEPNPPSPKRLRRLVQVDRSFTPPLSPPARGSQAAPLQGIDSRDYDREDDPVINAIIHVLQLSDNTPLSTRELSSSILERHLCPLDSPNPSSVVSSRITSHLKRRAAEKPPREPLLIRSESENGRKRTEYHIKYPELVSDRSPLYTYLKSHGTEAKVLQTVPASKLNIITSDLLDILDADEYDAEDISNRSPDRPTLFDPPLGVVLSPDQQPYDNLLGSSMMVEIDVPTGIKLDYEFFEVPPVPVDNLTPPSEDLSYPNTPSKEVFSRRESPVDPSDVETASPAEDNEPDDPQSPHSGAPDSPNTLPTSFYDSPLIYRSSRNQPEQVEMTMEDVDQDEVRFVEMRMEKQLKPWMNESDFTWEQKRDEGDVPSPEKVGVDELEEWLEGL